MKRLLFMERLLKKVLPFLTIFMMPGQLGYGRSQPFANELKVGGWGSWMLPLCKDKQNHPDGMSLLHRGYHVWLYPDHP